MKGKKKNFSDYSTYFNLKLPGNTALLVYLIALGWLAGIASAVAVHGYLNSASVFNGASAGVIVITVPALLAALLFRVIRRRLKMKHTLFATLIVTALYALFIIVDAVVFASLNLIYLVHVKRIIIYINSSVHYEGSCTVSVIY